MSGLRLAGNRDFFERDLVRDYCGVYLALREQWGRLLRDGNVSHSALNVLLGESVSKGVFWRLKDMAHYLFRGPQPPEREGGAVRLGLLVDWCVGYAFHECLKLREDAYQAQHYAAALTQLARSAEAGREDFESLAPLSEQTAQSSRRELERMLRVLRTGMELLARLLAYSPENCPLARWLVTQSEAAEAAFGPLHGELLEALYGGDARRARTLAAADLLDCGRVAEARELLRRAREGGLLDEDGESLLEAAEGSAALESEGA